MRLNRLNAADTEQATVEASPICLHDFAEISLLRRVEFMKIQAREITAILNAVADRANDTGHSVQDWTVRFITDPLIPAIGRFYVTGVRQRPTTRHAILLDSDDTRITR